MNKSRKIYVAGHRGLVGSAIMRQLDAMGCTNILTRTHSELDLVEQAQVKAFFAEEKPEYVFLAAAKVGGIHANNTYPMLSHINVGTGIDCTIREMSETVKKVVGFEGELSFDTTKPDGAMRKLMDVSRLKAMGWEASIGFEEGLAATYQWYMESEVGSQ